jgi:RNA polymerase sigma-70 factor (ECF subfamily)
LDHNQAAVPNGAEASMRIKDINKAVHDLPSIFRQPFMFYFEGYKYHEIADMLNEPLGTIKSRIHFARRLLKAELNKF